MVEGVEVENIKKFIDRVLYGSSKVKFTYFSNIICVCNTITQNDFVDFVFSIKSKQWGK